MELLKEQIVIGADIGGSHITAAQVLFPQGQLVESSIERRKIDPHASAEEILANWVEALRMVRNQYKGGEQPYLAISMPGPFDYVEGVSLIKGMNKYEALYGLSIRAALASGLAIPDSNILFVNDAEAFLKGEALCGAAQGFDKAFGITLGTGLGSAIYRSGVVSDLNLGSSPFLAGIAEDYISTRGIIAHYRSLGGTTAMDVKELVMEQQSIPSVQALRQLSNWLVQFLSLHLPRLTPEVVVIGGNIAKAHPHFLPSVRQALQDAGFFVPIHVASMGEGAAIIGASSFLYEKTL
ncbi:ROK family protein [Olivibacter sitiensis]|uniref:ROK family protein n=1 Tax=Olivibacter sitiensis TaxID=376470 RepID=UPI0004101180|nr:ROK family protein [Olivibacter sitiensis]